MKHLQHPLKSSETPKTYTYNMQAVEASFLAAPFSSSVAPFSSLRSWRPPPQPWHGACGGRGRSNITNIQLQHHKITVETKKIISRRSGILAHLCSTGSAVGSTRLARLSLIVGKRQHDGGALPYAQRSGALPPPACGSTLPWQSGGGPLGDRRAPKARAHTP
jgi:hypothetical protein